MILLCRHDEGTQGRAYRVCESVRRNLESTRETSPVSIEERDLAWFYVAPGSEDDKTSRDILAWARGLLGPRAWAVMQVSDSASHRLCRELQLKIATSYRNDVDEPSALSVHVVTTGDLR